MYIENKLKKTLGPWMYSKKPLHAHLYYEPHTNTMYYNEVQAVQKWFQYRKVGCIFSKNKHSKMDIIIM